MNKKKIKAYLEITECTQCPHHKSERDYTEDSWEYCVRIDCKHPKFKEPKNVRRYVDWHEDVPVPEWCPLLKKKKSK